MGARITFKSPPAGFDVNAFFSGRGLTVLRREKTDSSWTVEVQEAVSDKMREAIVEVLFPMAAGLSVSGRFLVSPDGSVWEETVDDLGVITPIKVT